MRSELHLMQAEASDVEAPVFRPGKLGPLTLRNRVIKAATFEGMTPAGLVTDELVDFHRRVAAGGVGMTTVAYLAVAPEGRTHAQQIHMREEAVPGLRLLTDAVHQAGCAAAAQIGHAGPVANPASNGSASLAPSTSFNLLGLRLNHVVDDGDIRRIIADHGRAARLAVEAGFDAIEIHLGHNYLISSFLSPRLNRRRDEWGGNLENRARFAREVARTVRHAAGPRVAVTAKLNMSDGVRGGLGVEESIEVARLLAADGALDALVLTGGSSLRNPMYLLRGDAPLHEFSATLPPLVRAGFWLFGKRFMPAYPFKEAYFLPYARRFLDALNLRLVLLGGISTLATMNEAIESGFSFVAMARALLREPDFINKLRAGSREQSTCTHCNRCMPTIYSGTRCVLTSEDQRGEVEAG
ncbi:MAG TPA: NADH:flavin oxidoreductase [Polyangiaceae bacterium]|jgi:2,4-dienoyl-CoA reductase-like NADH-dependent reductase (Old Yellow Enzyme family)|nr:NADH:flavin oxidoreductase [Polyangiaceae bacterium]